MSAAVKSRKKYVLQQSNCNFDAPQNENEDHKGFMLRHDDESAQETENQVSPKKTIKSNLKSETKKLRNVRLELSSLKRGGHIQTVSATANVENEFSSGESSEEELKKMRKVRSLVPNYVTNSDSGPCRKPRQSRQDPATLSSQNSSKLGKAQPLSIARRNARERNRVKQVNEGFATLRSRIPDYISEAYNEEKGRRSAKKLSKVETLRMAVDYIRHLETLLDRRSSTDASECWIKGIKAEDQPWETPNSSEDYPSPVESKYQSSPPGPFYDQAFEYQDRIFYDYDLDFLNRKENFISDRKTFTVLEGGVPETETESQCVDNFKYYESFDKLKKEMSEDGNDENLAEDSRDSENFKGSQEPEVPVSPKSPHVIKKASKKTVLPSITESFSKGIPVFY